MKLIIQSDDLGITEAVSCGIARAAREGRLLALDYFLICQQLHFP